MRREVAHLFDVDADAITVIHNGIESRGWRVGAAEVRRGTAAAQPGRRAAAGVLRPAGVGEGRARPDRRAAQDPGTPSRDAAGGGRQGPPGAGTAGHGAEAPGAQGGATSSGTCPTGNCARRWPRRTRWCCPAGTSRSASWRWRRRRPGHRWWRRRRAGWARSWWTAGPACRSHLATYRRWPTAVHTVLADPAAARTQSTGGPQPAADRLRLEPHRRGDGRGLRQRPREGARRTGPPQNRHRQRLRLTRGLHLPSCRCDRTVRRPMGTALFPRTRGITSPRMETVFLHR